MRSLWQSCASVQLISATGRQNRFLLISDCFWGVKYPSIFCPKQMTWIIATTPELSLNTKMWNVYKFDGSRSTLLFFRSQTGQQQENIFLSPPPFFLLFVFCSKEKHTCCLWHKNYQNVETLKYPSEIWMKWLEWMDGWMDSPFRLCVLTFNWNMLFDLFTRCPQNVSWHPVQVSFLTPTNMMVK